MGEASEREARRRAHFAAMEGTFPFPLAITDPQLPGGQQLDDDEFVVLTGKDWGVSISPLLLTTRRLICPADPSSRSSVAIPLADIRDVRLRKPMVGFSTVVIESADQARASFPAHINGPRIREDITAMVEAVKRPASPRFSVVGSEPSTGDRYERLRRIGELRTSGVLSEAEFQKEKARILKEP